MDRGKPVLGQIRNDRVAAVSRAVGHPRGKRTGTGSVKVPRWQVLIILSSATGARRPRRPSSKCGEPPVREAAAAALLGA